MKSKRSVFLSLIICTISAAYQFTPASAQEIAVFGSYLYNDQRESSFGAGGYLGLPLLDLSVADLNLDFRASYLSDVVGKGDVGMVPLEGGLSVSFLRNFIVSPFAGAGAGYYYFDSNELKVDDSWGWYAVAGARLAFLLRTQLHAELLYRDANTSAKGRAGNDYVDANIQGLGLNVGLGFNW